METQPLRVIRYLMANCEPNEKFYGYSIAKALDLEPQRVNKLFRRWAKSGFLKDEGLEELPEGLKMGPPPHMYSLTEHGLASFQKSISIATSTETA